MKYVDYVYDIVKTECAGLDSIYKEYLIDLVGVCGLNALRKANLIEACGVINGRQLYVLCRKE